MTFDPNEHDHDEDDHCLNDDGTVYHPPAVEMPNWEWSTWDSVGIAAVTIGGMAKMFASGLELFARECYAAANNVRERREAIRQEEAAHARRQLIIEDIRSLEGGGDDG